MWVKYNNTVINAAPIKKTSWKSNYTWNSYKIVRKLRLYSANNAYFTPPYCMYSVENLKVYIEMAHGKHLFCISKAIFHPTLLYVHCTVWRTWSCISRWRTGSIYFVFQKAIFQPTLLYSVHTVWRTWSCISRWQTGSIYVKVIFYPTLLYVQCGELEAVYRDGPREAFML